MDAYQELLRELRADSKGFVERGRGYALLQQFFGGESIESLRELLRSDDVFVQRTAMFVASELGSRARPLLADVCPLLQSKDVHVAFNVLEVIAVCAVDCDMPYYEHIVLCLDNIDKVLRKLAMYLMSRAEESLLVGVRDAMLSNRSLTDKHIFGFDILIGNAADPQTIKALLFDDDVLRRSYAAIAARRSAGKWPELMDAVKASDDPVLSGFAAQF
jgi:HEAT repeat protein